MHFHRYQLDKLIYYTLHYNNLKRRHLLLGSLEIFLEQCRLFDCLFVYYPSFVELFPHPIDYLSINSIDEYFYHHLSRDGYNLFLANSLFAFDNLFYKIIVSCIFLIVTHDLAKVRLNYLFMTYVL